MLLRAYRSSLQLILEKYFLRKGNTKHGTDTKLRTQDRSSGSQGIFFKGYTDQHSDSTTDFLAEAFCR